MVRRVLRVDPALAIATEHLGTKRKYWFVTRFGIELLFKAEERGTGEDWAEVIACVLAEALGLPCVHYALAVETTGNARGVISANCAVRPTTLVLGNQLLLSRDMAYPAEGAKYKVRAHTISAVADVLRTLERPTPQWTKRLPAGIESALDVFIGYLLLDTWIANQDRHHENWGALIVDGRAHLAPTFDHGAALARNLTDAERERRLNSTDVRARTPAFAAKARSAFYKDAAAKQPLGTFAAWRALASESPVAANTWLAQLAEIDKALIEWTIGEIPRDRMTTISRIFTLELLLENKRRLLAGDKL